MNLQADQVNEADPIISFCTDIKDSVRGIENDGEKAFKQYYYYINTVAEFYIKQLQPSEADLFKSSLWVPGDALWGVANSRGGRSLKNDIVVIFARIVSAVAYGLALTHIWSKEQEIPPLQKMNMRAAAFYGEIFKESLSCNYVLYNGRCLNACGRIQGEAELNSMVLGFIFKQNHDPAKQKINDLFHIELPVIDYNSIHHQIGQILSPYRLPKSGCTIKFNTIRNEANELLLHFATYPTQKLKGLEDTIIVTTKIEFQVDDATDGFRIDPQEEGISYRQEYRITKFDSIDLFSLFQVVTDNKLGYLQKIYNNDNKIIFKYDHTSRNFILEFKGDVHCPRVNDRGIQRKSIIDFSKTKYCILPAYNASIDTARGKAILVYTKSSVSDQETAIIFTEISSSEINNIEDYNYYYDSADPCLKFTMVNQ